MTVFKGYMKIIQRNLAYMLAFFLIFAVISILTGPVYGKCRRTVFSAGKRVNHRSRSGPTALCPGE